MTATDTVTNEQQSAAGTEETTQNATSSATSVKEYYCPECGTGPVAFQEGCFLCYACGYSKCS